MRENKNFTNVNVKYLRENKGISQTKLAKDLKIDTSTIAKWENNSRQITLDWAIKLANYFDIDVGSFISINQVYNSKNKNTDENLKKVLEEKGLLDEEGNLDQEKIDKINKIYEVIENKKEQDYKK